MVLTQPFSDGVHPNRHEASSTPPHNHEDTISLHPKNGFLKSISSDSANRSIQSAAKHVYLT
jgi:hypothetical protein